MASRPTTVNTVNTTNNNTNLLIVDFNKSTIKDSVENNFTLEHLNEGIKGVAKFTKDYIVKPEEGKRKYICSDPSRCVFKYRDENGVVQKDVRAVKLKNVIKDPIITKSKNLFTDNSTSNSNSLTYLFNFFSNILGVKNTVKKIYNKQTGDSNITTLGITLLCNAQMPNNYNKKLL